MCISRNSRFHHVKFIYFLLIIFIICANADDETTPVVSIKCGECACVNPCSSQQVPPPPPPPPPPPKASTEYCPPVVPVPPPPRFIYYTGLPNNQVALPAPPPPRFAYVTGPPGELYPTDPFNLQIYSGGASRAIYYNNIHEANYFILIVIMGCGILLQLLV